jgi:hypothetical protein
MKNFFFLLPVFFTGSLFGQTLRVNEGSQSTLKGNQSALIIEIPFVSEEFVADDLKSYLKDWGKCKEIKGEYVVSLGEWKDYGSKLFDVYAHVEKQKNGGATIFFSIDLGGAFLNSNDHSDKYTLFKKSIEAFGRNTASKWINDELDKEAKILKSLEKEQADLEEDKSDFEKEIEDYKKRIEENQKKIQENISNQEKQKNTIKTQASKIEEIEKKKKEIY